MPQRASGSAATLLGTRAGRSRTRRRCAMHHRPFDGSFSGGARNHTVTGKRGEITLNSPDAGGRWHPRAGPQTETRPGPMRSSSRPLPEAISTATPRVQTLAGSHWDNSRCGSTAASTPTPFRSPPAAGWSLSRTGLITELTAPPATPLSSAQGHTRLDWPPIPNRVSSSRPVAESSYTPSRAAGRRAGGLIVLCVKPTPGKLASTPKLPRLHHPGRPTGTGRTRHAGHAEIENAIRDLDGVAVVTTMNHLPPGRFPASRWRKIAHNLAR